MRCGGGEERVLVKFCYCSPTRSYLFNSFSRLFFPSSLSFSLIFFSHEEEEHGRSFFSMTMICFGSKADLASKVHPRIVLVSRKHLLIGNIAHKPIICWVPMLRGGEVKKTELHKKNFSEVYRMASCEHLGNSAIIVRRERNFKVVFDFPERFNLIFFLLRTSF